MLQNLRFSSQFQVMAKVLAVKEACTMWKIYYQHDYLYIHYLLSLSLILRLQSQFQESGDKTKYFSSVSKSYS